MGDKYALPSTGMRHKELLTRGIALLAGGAMPLAFAPVGWAWLAMIALAAFFALTAQSSKRQVLWSAY
ncbi:MAG: apolipoprotein N-acyltransferase, partial [Pseudomonadales bacterium]|nr:apolipoprotein N-acyltransferase [Pseudomonadales bacterium]